MISVGMLSEGWDAKTVTHIMGLRAFTSQLLCEQVVGRGLRRTSYDVNPETGLFEPEYVNIFGVPGTDRIVNRLHDRFLGSSVSVMLIQYSASVSAKVKTLPDPGRFAGKGARCLHYQPKDRITARLPNRQPKN